MSEYQIRPSRKLVDTSFIWRRLDNSYSCLGGSSLVDAFIYYCQYKGVTKDIFGRNVSKEIDEYLKKRDIELSNSIDDQARESFDTFKGTMLIESRSKHDDIWHKVRVSDIVKQNSTDKRKDASLRSMNILCDCLGAHYQTFLTVPKYVREMFNDKRNSDSIPAPNVGMVIDTHGALAMNYLVDERKAEDFGIFGLSDNMVDITEYVFKSALDKNVPEYKFNLFLRDKTTLFDPLRERLGIKA